MMEFTKEEIQELTMNRINLRGGNKTSKSSVKSNTSASLTDGDQMVQDKMKKGIFGLFGKKDRSKQNMSAQGPSPIKQVNFMAKK